MPSLQPSDMWVASEASPIPLPVSTLAVVVLLAPTALVWLIVEALHWTRGNKFGETVLTLLRCSTTMALVLFLCYWCEHGFYAEKAEKFYSPAMYWGTFGVLLVVSLFTVRKCPSSDFMNRDQTEEWKGWMQFLFIQYHYWKMESAYKDIRVYITCYLWMTGFGNLSFFFTKGDFSFLRVLQMVWRMNFFVFFLCLTMDNPYIVYYICPLHTFFFIVSYVTMAFWSSINRTEYGAVMKVAACAIIFYLFYDVVPKVFHPVFQWLGTESTHAPIGGHGVEWEWYFRSFLDHYSTIWGMVFALNMPYLATWFQKVENLTPLREWGAKLTLLAAMVVMFVFWARDVYSREKFDYNAIHCYYGIVPLLSYLLLRNISKTIRSYYFHSLHWFGTITLESYLLQYHIWLADNAAKLLNIVPGQWFLTFILASLLHVFCAWQIFTVTNKLRDIFLPNNTGQALRNLAFLLGAVLICYGLAFGFVHHNLSPLHLIWLILGLAALGFACLTTVQTAEKKSLWGLTESHTIVSLQTLYAIAFFVFLVVINALLRSERYHKYHPVQERQAKEVPKYTVLAGGADTTAGGVHGAEQLQLLAGDVSLGELMGFEFMESFNMGRLCAFVVGSLAQRWHGLVATLAVLLCLFARDAYFGITRLALFIWAPEGSKHLSYEEAYGPVLAKLGVQVAAAAPTEQTPLAGAEQRPAQTA